LGIKLKNIKYSKISKVIGVIMAWLCFVSICGSVFFLIKNDQIVASNSYYSYPKYVSNFSTHVVSIVDYYIWLKGPKSEEEIRVFYAQEDDDIVNQKMASFHNATRVISKNLNFAYYIKNTETGEIITNVNVTEWKEKNPVEILKKQQEYVFINQKGINYDTVVMYHLDEIAEKVNETPYEVHCAVIEPLKKGDEFYNDYIYYKRVKTITAFAIVLMVVSFILLLGVLIYLFYFAGRDEKSRKLSLSFIDRIYVDIQTLIVFIFFPVYISCFRHAIDSFYGSTTGYIFGIIILLSVAFFVVLTYLLSLTRQKKAGKILENILFLKILKKIKDFIKICYNGKIFRVWILLILPLYTFINILLAFAAGINANRYNGEEFFLFTVVILAIVNLAAFFFTARGLKAISIIMEGTKQISGGNLDYKMDVDKMSLAFAAFAENICNIQGGLKKAVDKAIKGERMKTELITNVTHDLKTPLTSIINYVDLLKGEEIGSKKGKEYIGVLEEKSARLKVLIEDLVEASKASSGNMPVNLEKVNLYELVMQVYGEFQEKSEKAALDIRINAADRNIFVLADGKHMWRIMENLMSNALKYSMKGSRVYINISKNNTDGVLTIKNISALPLEIPAERLTERFVRGDESRTTEGSGLGISIAQSLTYVQKGKFNIEIDGDLFKVIVEIPLCEE
jgi:signal transduction histidine kinase